MSGAAFITTSNHNSQTVVKVAGPDLLVVSTMPPCLRPVIRVGLVGVSSISSYIVGPCTCTETMALNGYINICILWQEFSNWPPIYSLG